MRLETIGYGASADWYVRSVDLRLVMNGSQGSRAEDVGYGTRTARTTRSNVSVAETEPKNFAVTVSVRGEIVFVLIALS